MNGYATNLVSQDWINGFRDGYFGKRPTSLSNQYRIGFRKGRKFAK